MLTVQPHALLDLHVLLTTFPRRLDEIASQPQLVDLLSLDAAAPMQSDDRVRKAVRDLLRHGGFKPTGRSKPASEYLLRTAEDGSLSTINVAVDACNAVSLHSGLPISVIDLDRAEEPFRVAIAEEGASYVFNPSGQAIDLGGLLCLFDNQGPCANGVKDSQRTKTSAETRRTLSLIWGSQQLPGRAGEAMAWYQELLAGHGASLASVLG
ncbi:MAG: hypothetical protein GTO53_05020 [Planctomycetales bacterium]|nr:hypothetical protein [Planctomycetales bacterium]NIM08514.1 hypothetical protein [Planctomycetales bacterium]NIN07988.1 hypothetical protein [Planctomycetales bacterium]NIN77117.1 hypothetical protein [Planctomycetales bacterium]NIO34301.1 hypothetical protein [Planctomycetales bacterium]